MKELKLGINLLELSYGECNIFLKSEVITWVFLIMKEMIGIDLIKALLKLNEDKGESFAVNLVWEITLFNEHLLLNIS